MSNALAPYTHHLPTCARVTDADDCNCGLNDAILHARHGPSASQREEERLALTAHVEVLTQQLNEVTRACGALIQAQRQNEARLDACERATAVLSARRTFWQRVRERFGL